MKKILTLIATAAIILSGTTPANADAAYFDTWQWWGFPSTQTSALAYNGSLQAGTDYMVMAYGNTPNDELCSVMIKELGGSTILASDSVAGAFNLRTIDYTAGAAGTYAQFGLHIYCANTGHWNARFMTLNFEAVPPPVVVPENPVAKPTLVSVPLTESTISGGSKITISGTGLSTTSSVTVGGVAATVISKTDTSITIEIPARQTIGAVDIVVTTPQGSVTSSASIVYTTNPVLNITKTKSITGFTASSKALTTAQKSAVKTLISVNPTLTQLSCAAKTVGVAASKSELAKAKSLATATCAYAKTLKKTLVTSSSASQSLPKAKASRTVLLTLKN